MRILITGAGGQLGCALQTVLTGHEIIALKHAKLDVTRLDEVRDAITAHHPQIVINAAGYTNVDGAESDYRGAFKLNAVAPRNLAIVTHQNNIPLLHVSTDYVFDGLGDRPYHEYDPANPRSIYGKSKMAGEQSVASLNPLHYIVRTAWLYHTEGRNFLKTMLAQSEKAEVCVVSDQYGSPTFAPHLATGIARLIELGAYGIYHLAGQGGTSWFDLTQNLYEIFKIKTRVRPVATAEFPRPAARPRYSVLTTIQDPQILLPSWQEGLAAFVREMS